MRGYIDWNNDCVVDDISEIVYDNRSNGENGADIAVPKDAAIGDLTVRFMVHNGRLKSACQTWIDGEIKDYTLRIFKRNNLQKPKPVIPAKEQTKALQIFPNPILENQPFVVKLGTDVIHVNDLTIYSATGQYMETQNLVPGEYSMRANRLQAGLYIFELKNELATFHENVIITK
jgi:hypothetical protein